MDAGRFRSVETDREIEAQYLRDMHLSTKELDDKHKAVDVIIDLRKIRFFLLPSQIYE